MIKGLSTNNKYVVVGFPKCGQVSLVNYLTAKGFDVTRMDCIWRSNARQLIEEQQPDRIPIIITRDKVDMIWSSYWYWPYNTYMRLEKYLKHYVPNESSLGTENPIDHADYERHISKFEGMNPIMLKFEDLVKYPDYPHDNQTVTKPKLNDAYRNMIEEALDSREINIETILADERYRFKKEERTSP